MALSIIAREFVKADARRKASRAASFAKKKVTGRAPSKATLEKLLKQPGTGPVRVPGIGMRSRSTVRGYMKDPKRLQSAANRAKVARSKPVGKRIKKALDKAADQAEARKTKSAAQKALKGAKKTTSQKSTKRRPKASKQLTEITAIENKMTPVRKRIRDAEVALQRSKGSAQRKAALSKLRKARDEMVDLRKQQDAIRDASKPKGSGRRKRRRKR